MSFVKISSDKRYLLNQKGQPFFMLGSNYEGYFDRAWHMWDDNKFDPTLIKHDFQKMADMGLNTVRLFVLPALDTELRGGNFSKLDKVLQIAADHKQSVLLTFNDSHSLNLQRAAELDAKIADRYQDDPVILGWDLENEPVFYNFAAASYPANHPAPIQTSVLVDHYGPRVSQAEAVELQRQRRIPAHLNPQQAFYYINALKYFIEFDGDAAAWANAKGVTLVEYLYTNDSAKWHKLIEALNGTVAAWLAARHAPVRAADPNHLITVGYNWLHFAGLPANRALDFQEYHKYGSASLSKLNQIIVALKSLTKVFPNHPIMMGEMGYSNHTSTNPATSQPVDAELTALFESAQLMHLRANNYAGGLKWMLNDVDTTANPYEASFGIYRVGDHPKPIKDLLKHHSTDWAAPPTGGTMSIVQDRVGLAFRFDLAEKTTLGGGVFQDESFSWQAENIGYCYLSRANEAMTVTAPSKGHLAFDPWEVVPAWDARRQSILYRMGADSQTQLAVFPAEERVAWNVVPGITYRVTMGAPVEPPSPEEPEIIPNPGEHVMLLADPNDPLRLSLPYIRHFAPDITFAAEQTAGRWMYVTVVATPEQIPDSVLDDIKAKGAKIVDRINGDIAAVLDGLVAKDQRFLAAVVEPEPGPPDDPQPDPEPVTVYAVQSGDSLSKISLKFYGKSSLWGVIFEANRDILDSPSRIRPGMQLKIPSLE